MEKYFQTYTLLGLDNGNLPVHRGMRQKRYESVEKMLDLLDVARKIGPKAPWKALFLDPQDPEWDDDMTYLYLDSGLYKGWATFTTGLGLFFLYNYRVFFHNRNYQFVTKLTLGFTWITSNLIYMKYRKQLLRCNLFDEYVQMRADELVKQNESMLRSEEMKKFVWYTADLHETLMRCHRQAYNNDSSDFADSELLLQDFIRRYTDETEEMPLSGKNAHIG